MTPDKMFQIVLEFPMPSFPLTTSFYKEVEQYVDKCIKDTNILYDVEDKNLYLQIRSQIKSRVQRMRKEYERDDPTLAKYAGYNLIPSNLTILIECTCETAYDEIYSSPGCLISVDEAKKIFAKYETGNKERENADLYTSYIAPIFHGSVFMLYDDDVIVGFDEQIGFFGWVPKTGYSYLNEYTTNCGSWDMAYADARGAGSFMITIVDGYFFHGLPENMTQYPHLVKKVKSRL